MDRRELEYFLAVVEHGSVTAAAQALHIAQPSLSQALRSLERELGVALFRRLPRGMRPTPAGEALVRPARQVLRGFEGADAAVRAVSGLLAGRLDVAVVSALSVVPVAGFVTAFRHRFPDVRVRLHEPQPEHDVAKLVLDGTCEVGFALTASSDPEIVAMELAPEEVCLALPPGATVPATTVPVSAIADLELIVGTDARHVLCDLLGRHGVVPRLSIVTAHREAIVPLVVGGAGATLLPASMAADAVARGAQVRRIRPLILRQCQLVHGTSPLSPAAARFVDLCRAHTGSGTALPDAAGEGAAGAGLRRDAEGADPSVADGEPLRPALAEPAGTPGSATTPGPARRTAVAAPGR